eukprot:3890536-Rhodomonas_salina.1
MAGCDAVRGSRVQGPGSRGELRVKGPAFHISGIPPPPGSGVSVSDFPVPPGLGCYGGVSGLPDTVESHIVRRPWPRSRRMIKSEGSANGAASRLCAETRTGARCRACVAIFRVRSRWLEASGKKTRIMASCLSVGVRCARDIARDRRDSECGSAALSLIVWLSAGGRHFRGLPFRTLSSDSPPPDSSFRGVTTLSVPSSFLGSLMHYPQSPRLHEPGPPPRRHLPCALPSLSGSMSASAEDREQGTWGRQAAGPWPKAPQGASAARASGFLDGFT